MKKLVLLVTLLPIAVCAQVVRQPLLLRYAGLGAYSNTFNDVLSGTSNQAAFAKVQSGGLGVYGERRFFLADLGQYTAVIALPTPSGTFALQADYFGSIALNETQLGFAYARPVSKQVDVGIKFNYHTIRVPAYGNASAINFEAGSIFHLTDKVHAGIHVYNPFGSKFGKMGNETLPAIFKTGMGYEASTQLLISGEIVKQEDQPVNVNVGLHYKPQERILIRAGVSTSTNSTFAGVGFHLGMMRLDVNTAYHPQLGFTPGLILVYRFGKEDAQ